jgi:hypothetical protein
MTSLFEISSWAYVFEHNDLMCRRELEYSVAGIVQVFGCGTYGMDTVSPG